MVVERTSLLQRGLWILDTLGHQALAIITIVILWTIFANYELNSEYTWHMILCTLAYVPLMAEAIVLFSGDNLWSQNITRTTKYIIHGVLLGVSALAVTIGIFIFSASMGPDADHFKGDHALTGLVSWIFVVLAVILGFFSSKANELKSFARPVYFKFVHNLFGIIGYVVGIASLGYALKFRSFSGVVGDDVYKATLVILCLVAVWSLIAALKSGFNQIKTIFS